MLKKEESLDQFIQRLKEQMVQVENNGVPATLEKRLNKSELVDIFKFVIQKLEEQQQSKDNINQEENTWSFQRKNHIKKRHTFWWDEYEIPRSIAIIKPNTQSFEFQLMVNVKSKKAAGWKGNFPKFLGNFKKGKEAYRIDHVDTIELHLELVNTWKYTSKDLKEYLSNIQKEIDLSQSLDSRYVLKIQYGGIYKDSKGNMRHRIYSPKAHKNLKDVLEQKPFPFTQDQLVILQENLLYALQYLHHNAIAHGDIKIENIVLDSENNPKFIDLGSAVKNDSAKQGNDIKALGRIFVNLECALNNMSWKSDYEKIESYSKQQPVLQAMYLNYNKEEFTIDSLIQMFHEHHPVKPSNIPMPK